MSIDEKLDKIKNSKLSSILQEQIQEWEHSSETNRLWIEYKELECSKRIVRGLKVAIQGFDLRLVDEDEPILRAGYKAEKRACQAILNYFDKDYKSFNRSIESSIDEELEQYEEI